MRTSALLRIFMGLLMAGLLLSARPGFSRTLGTPDPNTWPEVLGSGIYLVVGVFSFEDNAKKFTDYVARQGWTVQYAYYPGTQYYYVYTFTSGSKPEVVEACLDLRANSEFSDAWVLVAPDQHTATQERTTTDIAWGAEAPNPLWSNSSTVETTSYQPEQEENKIGKTSSLYLKFRTYHVATNETVSAMVNIVDGARSKSLGSTTTEQTQEIDKTMILDSSLQIIPQAIGFRRVQYDLPLYASAADSLHQFIAWEGDTLVMNMPLHRLRKGDIQVMYNTYFHSNSSVMRERSRYELDELVTMLEESPDMRIKLHGHTNGNGRGFIYVFSPEEKNFFDLRRSKEYKKNGVGSTKLSALRAETIKSYLEDRGISPDRIETEGWGGKQMLYDPDSPLAQNNIRVEIEVLEE